jgi:predicted DsbA family dithiol-disulfide isomerase
MLMFAYAKENGFPEEYNLALLKSILKSVGGDPEELSTCPSAGTYFRAVEEAIAIARELGVSGTPTFFVNGWTIPGAYPYELFRGVIDWAQFQEEPLADPRSATQPPALEPHY